MRGGFAAQTALVHRDECSFDVAPEKVSVKQRMGAVVRCELLLERDNRAGIIAILTASASYSAGDAVTSSSRPMAWSRLAATRPAKVEPRQVRTGTPVQSASHAVVCAL
jgi:hypothetical protein